MIRKKLLFIVRRLPHSGAHAQETLDLILTAAAYEQPVSLLALDDGLFQLKTAQRPRLAGLKDISAVYQALALYDVNDIYVENEALLERGLTPADLILPVNLLNRRELPGFIQQFDAVIEC